MLFLKLQPMNACIGATMVCLLCLSWSCNSPQSTVSKYHHANKSMIGTPYHAMLEYVHEVRTKESFALVTIKPSSSDIVSRVRISFTSHQIVFDGREHTMKELKGKFVVSDEHGEKVEVLPSDFSFDAAEERVVKILAELNRPE